MKYLAHSLCMLERARARGLGRAREASRVTVVGGVIASVRARARARDRPGVINQFIVRPETCKSEREESSHRERY